MPLQANNARLPSIEIYRIGLMLGITLLHVAGLSRLGYDWLSNLLHPCVTAFAFLSGWFGCKCRPMKFVRLYGVAIFCAAVMTTVLMRSPYVATQFGHCWISQFVRMIKNYWFLHAYAFMMLLAPLIDSTINCEYSKESDRIVAARILPVVLLSFGWSFGASFQFWQDWLPTTPGLGAYTGLTLVGAYAAARYCRWSGCLNKISNAAAIGIALLCVGLAVFKLGRYNSPVALVLAALTFKFAHNMKQASRSCMTFLAPSMFSVYLLQVNDFMFPFIEDCAACMAIVLPSFLVVVILCIVIFVGCVLIDFVRRAVVDAIKRSLVR